MLRLSLMLSAAIYAVLVIYSDATPASAPAVSAQADATPANRSVIPHLAAGNTLETPDGRSFVITAVIDSAAISNLSDRVAGVTTANVQQDIETVTASASSGAAEVAVAVEMPLVEVTGTQVNLRAGPSTDDAVLGSLMRGEQAELVAAFDNGWARIRVASSGIEGFMANRFLAPLD